MKTWIPEKFAFDCSQTLGSEPGVAPHKNRFLYAGLSSMLAQVCERRVRLWCRVCREKDGGSLVGLCYVDAVL